MRRIFTILALLGAVVLGHVGLCACTEGEEAFEAAPCEGCHESAQVAEEHCCCDGCPLAARDGGESTPAAAVVASTFRTPPPVYVVAWSFALPEARNHLRTTERLAVGSRGNARGHPPPDDRHTPERLAVFLC